MKIGLTLSGGGFRATVFHLGVLARLAEENRLEDVTLLSTVSGGSLCGALVYAGNQFTWPTSRQFIEQILPKARTDFRQPPEMYALALEESGIDMPVEDLVARAEAGFAEIRNEMQALAPLVAKEKGFTVTDYRDVMRELKKDQLVGEAILPHYQARIKDLEKIIRDQHIVTLPARPMAVRLASEAESAAIPAPNMRPPRLIGNTGEMGTFVLPLRIPGKAGEGKLGFDDFTFAAASWTLTAHEGRPGHELQFSSMIERGVSLVEVPEEEFDSMGANVLALAPRRCLIVAGNVKTRTALERAGADVLEYVGSEISLKGGGGPTCLTRPLARAAG